MWYTPSTESSLDTIVCSKALRFFVSLEIKFSLSLRNASSFVITFSSLSSSMESAVVHCLSIKVSFDTCHEQDTQYNAPSTSRLVVFVMRVWQFTHCDLETVEEVRSIVGRTMPPLGSEEGGGGVTNRGFGRESLVGGGKMQPSSKLH